MAFSWTSITAGSTKVLADHANQVRNNANILITLMTANTGKCSSYSCSSLGTIPAEVTTGTTIVYTSWLDDMKATIDRIDTNKYCATADYVHCAAHNPTNCPEAFDTHNNSVKSGNYDTHYNGINSTYNGSKYSTKHSSACIVY